MKTRSAKSKGKRLEAWVREQLLARNTGLLTHDDIRITVGSETGADIKLSEKAKVQVPYSIEVKNRETFKTLYSYYDQAKGHYPELEPIVVLKMNHRRPLVLVDAELFFKF